VKGNKHNITKYRDNLIAYLTPIMSNEQRLLSNTSDLLALSMHVTFLSMFPAPHDIEHYKQIQNMQSIAQDYGAVKFW